MSGSPFTFPRFDLLSERRVLVTGASGFLGAHLTRRLIAENAIVAGLARTCGTHSFPQQENFRFYCCDITDDEAVRLAFRSFQPETLIHLAASADFAECFQHARDSVASNLLGTLNVLEAFRISGGSTLIYGDTCKTYGDSVVPYRESMPMQPLSSYAIAKAAGWEFCKQYSRLHGLCCVSVRPTMIYGPGQSLNLISFVAQSVLKGASKVLLDGGSQTRDLDLLRFRGQLEVSDSMMVLIPPLEFNG